MNLSPRRCALALALTAVAAAGVPTAAQAVPQVQTAPPSCGATIYKSAGTPWTCTFADEFSGSSLDTSKWIAQQTATSGYTSGLTACFVNSPGNIAVSGGTLRLTARKESSSFTCKNPAGDFATRYTSGMVSTYGRFSQAYGRFEFRAMMPASTIAGLQEALWLWPVDPFRYGAWPGSGELDVAEAYSQYPNLAVPYVHYNAAGYDPNVTNTSCRIANTATFHTYALEWTTSTMKFIYDGKTCLIDSWNPQSLVKPQPFDQPFIVALTQALGVGTNAFDPAKTQLPATTSVDYVHVWK